MASNGDYYIAYRWHPLARRVPIEVLLVNVKKNSSSYYVTEPTG